MKNCRDNKREGENWAREGLEEKQFGFCQPQIFQSSEMLEPTIYPFLHVTPLQNFTFPHAARSAQLSCPGPVLAATSSPSQQTHAS